MEAKIWNKSYWVKETDPKKLIGYYANELKQAEFEIIDYIDHEFEPMGFSAIWLLGESHLALHTFPEEGLTFVEISSCIESKFNIFCERQRELNYG